MFRYLFLCLLSFLVLFSSCSRTKEAKYPKAPVILITIDTLRSDHLSTYGYRQIETKAIDALGKDAVLFERAYAQAPLTLPSHASLLTGKAPYTHGARDNIGFRLEDQQTTLAEAFRQEGYRTGAVVSTMVLRKSTGIAQGFDFYDDRFSVQTSKAIRAYAQRVGSESVALAKAWIGAHKEEPIFFWLHLYDPHTPYDAPAPFKDSRYSDYDNEIRYVDAQLQDFFEFLKREGLYDPAIITLTSDHGEGLGEHGEAEHGILLYREAIQVPLIIKLPHREEAGRRNIRPVGLYDVAPTLARLVGVPFEAEGEALIDNGGDRAGRNIFSESLNPQLHFGWHAIRSVVHNDFHYIKSNSEQVFHLRRDAAEKSDVFGQVRIPKSAIRLLEETEKGSLNTVQISEEDRALLESLGYTGGLPLGSGVKNLPESRFLELFRKIGQCKQFVNAANFAGAEKLLVPLSQAYPEILDIRLMLGTCLTGLNKLVQAEQLYLETFAIAPKNISVLVGLAHTKFGLGKDDEAMKMVQKALELEPVLGGKLLLPELLKYKRFPAASSVASNLLASNPNYFYGDYALGFIAYERGQFEEAVVQLEKAATGIQDFEDIEQQANLYFFIADSLARLQQTDKAVISFAQALQLKPDHVQANVSLALLRFSMGQGREALDGIKGWLTNYPTQLNYLKAAEVFEIIGQKKQAQTLKNQAEQFK